MLSFFKQLVLLTLLGDPLAESLVFFVMLRDLAVSMLLLVLYKF